MTSHSERQQMLDEAAQWVAEMDGAGWNASRQMELDAWLDRDTRHAGALLQAEAAWVAMDELNEHTEPAFGIGQTLYRRRGLLAAAAAMAASLVGGLIVFGPSTTYETDIGEIRRVPLADGSVAEINTGSKLDISLAETERYVRIERGEAWFHVAKNAQRPFVVVAGDARVVAVGTAFSVRRQEGGVGILVTEGIVDVSSGSADIQKVTLREGQRAFVTDDAVIRIEPPVSSFAQKSLAWRNGRIDLIGSSLQDAISEFNRYNRRKMILLDQKLALEVLDGSFRVDDIEGFATAVKSSFQTQVDLSDPAVVRIGKANTI